MPASTWALPAYAPSTMDLGALPDKVNDLPWLDVQRLRLAKFAHQAMGDDYVLVERLVSSGETDTSKPAVIISRRAFTDFRALGVVAQYYAWSGDPAALARIKAHVLDWCAVNEPDGNSINETNFEWLLKAIIAHWDAFDAAEQAAITAWLNKLRTAKENYAFPANATRYGNHFTHHYKILLLCYRALGDETAFQAALTEKCDPHLAVNFPYGNVGLLVPDDMPRAATDPGESIDYIRRDALHYHQYDLEPWLEIAILSGDRYRAKMDAAFAFGVNRLLDPGPKHYEFAASTDPFDQARWLGSHSEYLQPLAQYLPSHWARVTLSYYYYRLSLDPLFAGIDDGLIGLAARADTLSSNWAYWFRLIFRGAYG